ncbi:MAG: folate-binding protein [Burkholderiaceae bacterium]
MNTPSIPSPPAARPAAGPAAPIPFDPAHPGWVALAASMQALGGTLHADAQGPLFHAAVPASAPSGGQAPAVAGLCPLPDYGLLIADGAEAGSFLQNQLTNDVLSMPAGEARWAGYCTPKGRLLTTALAWSMPGGFALAVARTQAESLRKRLSMYVLRTKARISDASADWLAVGLLGESIDPALAAVGLPRPDPAMAVSRRAQADQGAGPIAIALPQAPAGVARVMLWLPLADAGGPRAEASTEIAALRAAGPIRDTALWRWTEVRSGIPRLFPGSVELFVPQMVNFEAVGGVNFKKGCYPGQEIVARSQYLGKLKRRMFIGHLAVDATAALPDPGQDVVPRAGGEPSGQVVISAPNPAGGVDVLFESQIAAVELAGVRIGDADVELLALPYDLKR